MDKDFKVKKVYDKMMENDHCSRSLGVQLLDIKEGYSKLLIEVTKNMLIGFEILHGGTTFTVADSAFVVSTNGSMIVSKSAIEGEDFWAEAKLLNLSYRLRILMSIL